MSFAGSPDRVEARLVPEAGFELDTFRIAPLPRRFGGELATALWLAARAPRACRRILDVRRPDVVLGGGGYVSAPMVVAASRRRIPAAEMEADSVLGLANRVAAGFAGRVFLAYPIPGHEEPKFRVVGRPIPARSRAVPRDEARSFFELPGEGPVLGVFGALAGARSLNEAAIGAFGEDGPAVLHLCGERDYDDLRGRVSRPDYRLLPSTDRFGAALGAVDLALSRAGGTVWELAAAGTPAILVPYPHATRDHQARNAGYFEGAGGAVVLLDRDLARMRALVGELLEDASRLPMMSEAMRKAAKPDAAEKIAEELIALARA